MMLHRHFEGQKNENMTKLEDVAPQAKEEKFVSEVFPPDEKPVEAPKRRGRPPKKADN